MTNLQAFDPRLDELLRLGERITRMSALYKKISPIYAGHGDQRALFEITYALRQRFWTLARQLAGELPQ